ncbi:DUF6090 family protein [Lentiprolixibacter aurantiacus]|uniref:DUF6090 family protein n=1 Tax=Lentiprolixibacter aurantiacus TaxID=2993939 RepID=A0AAE3SM88_9FLAO|nr:DUF6090 family protein [Lentiprolixibacter aurantiacus]MCX2718021.1 DUF6090 family protein [Lentiprolixibacter aurantiacus]
MIKFFRRIRQKLLSENKFSKYLLYALGEIVLVVIGILIALAVNNWNQSKKESRLGDDLLLRIHRDLVKDTINFNSDIVRNDLLREDLKTLLIELYDGVDTMGEVEKMSATWDQMLDQAFSPNDNTYKSMLSSGTLGLIKNQDLKDEILDLYSEYDQTKVLLQAISEWMIGMASNMDSKTDFIKFGSSVSDIYTTEEMFNEGDYSFLNQKESPEFKLFVRTMSGVAFYQKANNGYRTKLIKKCKSVLTSIDQELSK